MTNLTATLIVTLSTNWVSVPTLQGNKEVGVVVRNTYVRTVEEIEKPAGEYLTEVSTATNDWLRSSAIVGQGMVREPATIFATNWSRMPILIPEYK